MKYLFIESIDPTLNLALEEQLFNELEAGEPGWFLLWKNSPTIVVGRNQNTTAEVNGELVDKYNLNVVRRVTGGGAVYHDLGNLNFSFIHNNPTQETINFRRYLEPIVQALEEVGIRSNFSGRNDLLTAGKKFSGSAQITRGQKVLHHGTILLSLDLNMLDAILTCSPDKYQSKGIASVRSRVINLSEVWPNNCSGDDIIESLVRNCADQPGQLTQESLQNAEKIAESKYRSWEWNYGKSPAFTEKKRRHFSWGTVECMLEVKRGIIENCNIYGDYFSTIETKQLNHALQGVKHSSDSIQQALADFPFEHCFVGCDPDEIRLFFCE